jgi:hypothetical protein
MFFMRNHTENVFVCAGLLLCSPALASANTLVSFQVDLSTATAIFDPTTQTVSAHGTFNAWAAFPLTNNPAGPNPSLWTGTADVSTNGTVMEYKYVINPGTYESIPKGNNRLATLPTTNGASLILPKVYFGDVTSTPISLDVTFQVDMAQQINIGTFTPGVSTVYPKGTFNSWGTFDGMTNAPAILRTNQYGMVTSNVYVGVYTISGSPGQTMDYKFYIDTGNKYEDLAAGAGDPSDNNNRFFNLLDAPAQTLPLVFFSDAPYSTAITNEVTFQVDMTVQIENGSFDPMLNTVELRGNFNSWGTPQILCTNDPAALDTNIYRAVLSIVDSADATEQYKFWSSSATGWENMANNRTFKMTNAPAHVLPVVYFNNVSVNDVLQEDTVVTFSINMTNAVGTDSHAFDPASGDAVYLNGVPNGFLIWDTALPQLTNSPAGSWIYSIDMLLPKGSSVVQNYKYSINGADNEAAQGSNHNRVVRHTGAYALPLDVFGTQYVEPSFGQLTIGRAVTNSVPLSWLGRPGVHLQTATDLSSGTWQDLPGTDGSTWTNVLMSTNGFVSVTNYPTGATQTFLRLIKP